MSRFELLHDLPEDLEPLPDFQPPSDLEPVNFSHQFFKDVKLNWAVHSSGCIAPVRDQMRANACYAIPSVDCVYAALCLEYEKVFKKNQFQPPLLAPQELINCIHDLFPLSEKKKAEWDELIDSRYGYPSTINKAFEYIKLRGVCSENHCPFEGMKQPCVAPPGVKRKVYITDYTRIDSKEKIMERLQEQPLAVSVPFVRSLQDYPGNGVYRGPTQSEKEQIEASKREGKIIPQHALQVIGWGFEDGDEEKLFYLCKNSWGNGWGHKGYIKVAKDVVESGRVSYPRGAYIGAPKSEKEES